MSTTHPTAKEIFDQLVALQKEMAEEDAKREKLCDALSTIPEEVDDEIRVNNGLKATLARSNCRTSTEF